MEGLTRVETRVVIDTMTAQMAKFLSNHFLDIEGYVRDEMARFDLEGAIREEIRRHLAEHVGRSVRAAVDNAFSDRKISAVIAKIIRRSFAGHAE